MLARCKAFEAGARGLTMPGATFDLLRTKAVTADSMPWQVLSMAPTCSLSAPGLELNLERDVSGGRWFAERGLRDRPEDFGNLPGGEVAIAPVNAQGILVVNGSINPLGLLAEPLTIHIEGRRVVNIERQQADELTAYLESFGPGAFIVAVIGIGINPGANVTGVAVMDEQTLGTVPIGFDNNSNMGGFSRVNKVDVTMHIDGVLHKDVSLFANGRSM